MDLALFLLQLLTVVSTGLLAGALLAEARVLVPYWQKMPIDEFLALHHTMASSLYRFYAPLTIAGTLVPMVMACVSLFAVHSSAYWLGSGLCAIALLLFYFLFFKAANASFATGPDSSSASATLATWARLHNARTAIAILGFALAILGLHANA